MCDQPDLARHPRFRRIVDRCTTVFAAPAIAFALLPSVVGADTASDGIALTATVTTLCALAGVLILSSRPAGRTLGEQSRGYCRSAGSRGRLALAAITAQAQVTWLLLPSAIVLGSAYELCLVAELVEIGRLADQRAMASHTA